VEGERRGSMTWTLQHGERAGLFLGADDAITHSYNVFLGGGDGIAGP